MSNNIGMGGNRKIDPELQAQLEAARAMSASFTKAGNKSRPGRSGGRGDGRVGGRGGTRSSPFQTAHLRPSYSPTNRISPRLPVASISPVSQSNIQGARIGAAGFSISSPATLYPPVFNTASPPRALTSVPSDGVLCLPKFGALSSLGNRNSSSSSAMIEPRVVDPLHLVAPSSPYTAFKASTVNVTSPSDTTLVRSTVHNVKVATTAGETNGQHTSQNANIVSTVSHKSVGKNSEGFVEEKLSALATNSQKFKEAPITSMAGRELIVTNWTEDVDKKPWIPAHLQQSSAFQAIQEIADMMDLPVQAITLDGCSIPRPREGARPLVAQGHPPTLVPGPRQPDVDPTGWFMAAKTNNMTTGSASSSAGQINLNQRTRNISDNAMDIDMSDVEGGNTRFEGGPTWSAPATQPAHTIKATHNTPLSAPKYQTTRPEDLSGSIWADESWNLPNKKENERVTNNNFSCGPRQLGFGNQPKYSPVNAYGGSSEARTGVNTASSQASTFNPASHASVVEFSTPIPRQEKKSKNLDDSIWA